MSTFSSGSRGSVPSSEGPGGTLDHQSGWDGEGRSGGEQQGLARPDTCHAGMHYRSEPEDAAGRRPSGETNALQYQVGVGASGRGWGWGWGWGWGGSGRGGRVKKSWWISVANFGTPAGEGEQETSGREGRDEAPEASSEGRSWPLTDGDSSGAEPSPKSSTGQSDTIHFSSRKASREASSYFHDIESPAPGEVQLGSPAKLVGEGGKGRESPLFRANVDNLQEEASWGKDADPGEEEAGADERNWPQDRADYWRRDFGLGVSGLSLPMLGISLASDEMAGSELNGAAGGGRQSRAVSFAMTREDRMDSVGTNGTGHGEDGQTKSPMMRAKLSPHQGYMLKGRRSMSILKNIEGMTTSFPLKVRNPLPSALNHVLRRVRARSAVRQRGRDSRPMRCRRGRLWRVSWPRAGSRMWCRWRRVGRRTSRSYRGPALNRSCTRETSRSMK